MKRKLSLLSGQYASALGKYLRQGPRASLQPARRLGRQAVKLGLETLDVVRIHQAALARLEASRGRNGMSKGAENFFLEAIIPIEKTHHAALKTNVRLEQLGQALARRSVDLAESNRFLKEGIARRATVEKALKESQEHSKKLLDEARRLQKQLQHLAHRIMAAHEDKRKKISHDLQDEIGQTLLGINVRLLTLRSEAAINTKGLKKEIASTQRLVDKSVRSIKRFARGIDVS